jgi:phospholipid-binding lipoprotein MlaA
MIAGRIRALRAPARALAAAALGALLLAGCATPPADPAARAEFERNNDPLEPTNRRIFAFNLAVDDAVGKPLARAYRDVPPFIRDRVRSAVENFNAPVVFINSVLQGEQARAAETFVRFFVNTSMGFGGLFDVAGGYGLKAHREDFGQTLAVWGFAEGPYLMLPFLGPSNARDLVGRLVDSRMNPLSYVLSDAGLAWLEIVGNVLDAVDTRERNLEAVDELQKTSLDFYASVRSFYRQLRASEIANGRRSRIPLPGEDEKPQ